MRKPQIHPVKSDRYISLMVTTRTSSSGRNFRIPKVIFPIFMVLLLVGGFFIGSVYTNFTNQVKALKQDVSHAQEQQKLIEDEKSSVEAVLSERDIVITELLDSIAEKEAQLNILEGQTQEILSKIENLEAIRDSIYEKLNEAPDEIFSSDTTASKTPYDVGNSSSPLSSSSNSTVSNDFDKQYADILSLLNSLDTILDENYQAMNTLADMVDVYAPYIESVPSGWPIKDSRITCPFGYRTNPLTGKGKEFHYGIDFAAKYKQNLYATASGTVTSAGYVNGYGYTIVIDHGYGYSTRYAHCTKLLFKKGDTVSKGDCIALAGRTGRSTAVHLHYEVIVNGKRVDPADYLD